MKKKVEQEKNEKSTEDVNDKRDKIGNRIAKLRREKGLSQIAFSNVIGVSLSSVCMWEQNKREPRRELRDKLCDFFNVDMNYLTGVSPIKNAYQAKGSLIKIFKLDDNSLDDNNIFDTMTLPEFVVDGDDDFAVVVSKSNVTKFGIDNKDLIVFRKTIAVIDDTIQLFEIDGKLAIKKTTIKGNSVYLEDDKESTCYPEGRTTLHPLGKFVLLLKR